MGKPQRRRGNTARNKHLRKAHIKTKRFTRDIDQVYEDIQPDNICKFDNPDIDEALPGLGQYYCITCAKHFTDHKSLLAHKTTKFHKRMVKTLKVEPHNHKSHELYSKY
jgi:bud site selection protein 20